MNGWRVGNALADLSQGGIGFAPLVGYSLEQKKGERDWMPVVTVVFLALRFRATGSGPGREEDVTFKFGIDQGQVKAVSLG